MSSALLERTTPAVTPYSGHTPTWQPGTYPSGSPASQNWCVVPRCTIEFEKCNGGFKMNCRCDDKVSSATLQNLCRMLADGLCSCTCTYNGITTCQCNFTIGHCRCEYTKDGCCVTCTSGDKECAAMLQAWCNALSCCCESGCSCYVCFNNTPVCCGTRG